MRCGAWGARWWRLGLALGLACGASCQRLTARDAHRLQEPFPSGAPGVPSTDRLAQHLDGLPEPRRHVVATALELVGRTPPGLDCSGLVQHVYAAARLDLPRTVREQLRCGRAVEADDLLPGDLVFFAFERRPADHVAVYAGDGCIVHASSAARAVQLAALGSRPFSTARVATRRLLPDS
jgi:hypothetical protein